MQIDILLKFLGGLGLFIYGMHIMASGLQRAADSKMKDLLSVLIKNKFWGVVVGLVVTAVIQSSSATTVMLVGFVNAGIMNLSQAVGVVMGANIGTTVTSLIVASGEFFTKVSSTGTGILSILAKFANPITLAPLAVGIGSFIVLLGQKEKLKLRGEILLGFGMLFVGMTQMTASVKPLTDLQIFKDIFILLGNNPILGVLAGVFVTAILQSSSATVGILQALAAAGLVPLSATVYLILGQNIGTCVTALLSSIGTSKNAKSVAYIHLLFNVIGSIIFTVGAVIFFTFINPSIAGNKATLIGISLIHISYNVLSTIILYPFSDKLIQMATWLTEHIKLSKKDVEKDFDKDAVHLDDRILSTPSFAIQNSFDEIQRLGDMTLDMLKLAIEAFLNKDDDKAAEVFKQEKLIDAKEQSITDYLVKIIKKNPADEEYDLVASLLKIVSDMERIADHCENIVELAVEMIDDSEEFSENATKELENMSNLVLECYGKGLSAFQSGSIDDAKEVFLLEEKIDNLEKDLRENHLRRLSMELCTVEGGVVFYEALMNFERISDHSLNIAQLVLKYDKK